MKFGITLKKSLLINAFKYHREYTEFTKDTEKKQLNRCVAFVPFVIN
jgi:hypothetical protein